MKQRKKHISTPRPRDQMRNPLGVDGFFRNNCKKEKQGYDLDDKDGQGLFPIYSEWIVFVVTLVLRCNYVSQKDNWWVLHPDEIFQAMEGKSWGTFKKNLSFKKCYRFSQSFQNLIYDRIFECIGGRWLRTASYMYYVRCWNENEPVFTISSLKWQIY